MGGEESQSFNVRGRPYVRKVAEVYLFVCLRLTSPALLHADLCSLASLNIALVRPLPLWEGVKGRVSFCLCRVQYLYL